MLQPIEQGYHNLEDPSLGIKYLIRINDSGMSLYSCVRVYVDRFSVAADISEGYKGNRKYDLLTEVKSSEDVEKGSAAVPEGTSGSTPQPHDKPRELSKFCRCYLQRAEIEHKIDSSNCETEYNHGLQIVLLIAAQCSPTAGSQKNCHCSANS